MAKERKVVPITIRFKPHLVEEVKALAEEENRSINGTVVEAVEHYIRNRRAQRRMEPGGADGAHTR